MARKCKEDAEKTRQAVIEAALDVFSEKGYAKATFDEIAARAGFTKGAVYWYFRNKADLVAALIVEYMERKRAEISEEIPVMEEIVEEIVEESGTSRGSFYHYFEGKDALLSSLSVLFDDKYEELSNTMDPELSPIDKLKYITQELFLMIENTVSVELLGRLFATQLTTSGERHLLNTNRTYYKLLRQITSEGHKQGLFKDELSINDITKAYAMFERGLMYDWCICNGNYSLCQYSATMMPLFLKSFCK